MRSCRKLRDTIQYCIHSHWMSLPVPIPFNIIHARDLPIFTPLGRASRLPSSAALSSPTAPLSATPAAVEVHLSRPAPLMCHAHSSGDPGYPKGLALARTCQPAEYGDLSARRFDREAGDADGDDTTEPSVMGHFPSSTIFNRRTVPVRFSGMETRRLRRVAHPRARFAISRRPSPRSGSELLDLNVFRL